MTRPWIARATQLVAGCLALGLGVGMVLSAGWGSDGYSSLVNGIVRSTGVPYAVVNLAIGFTLVVVAYARGVRPGIGTIVHPLVVGMTVNLLLSTDLAPMSRLMQVSLLMFGVALMALGVAVYLAADMGAGPLEGVALSLRRLPFRVAYNLLQALGALIGFALGADLGIGTLVVVVGTGPMVHWWRGTIRPGQGHGDRQA